MLVADNHPEISYAPTLTVPGTISTRPGSCYYITSKPEGSLHRIIAGYWPDEIAEQGIEGCRQSRGYDPIDFLVDDIEHARMLRDGVLDAVEGQNVLETLCDRADALSRGQREN